ncbi:hypothetical protein AB6A40_000532 [Gnathostoma spinigerum]|uniref:inositol-phosphate phosphatase n=1 Tax=Gnathostoma spinigerum TaxID=75299 RepID=A0ABD6E2B2_9BILA
MVLESRFSCSIFLVDCIVIPIKSKALNESLIAASHGIHNLVKFGESWMDKSLNNHRMQCLAGVHGHRSFGSAALNIVYVAQGCVDAYFEYGIHSWDVAAAALICKEAGGQVLDATGEDFDLMNRRILVASTSELAKAVSATLTHVEYEREA